MYNCDFSNSLKKRFGILNSFATNNRKMKSASLNYGSIDLEICDKQSKPKL
jgi:hypothetical protein